MDVESADGLGVTGTIVASVFAGLLGLGVGTITTFTHRQYPPFGLIVGLTVIAALIVGFRLVFQSRIVAGAAALGVLLAIAILALPGAGGSVVVADGVLGYVWVIGTPLIAATALVWPQKRRPVTE